MTTEARTPGPLERTLMALHDRFETALFAHQRALLDRDFAAAATALAGYREALFEHMRDEEELVLPRYGECGGDATDAPLRLFLGEHAKMREFVTEFGRRVATLARTADDRALLELFDREATYKNLVLHHDLRECNALYPFLSAHLDEEQQQEILAGLRLR